MTAPSQPLWVVHAGSQPVALDRHHCALGFRELQEVCFFSTEPGRWRLEIDDEPIVAEREGERQIWRWRPGFFAGEVVARLIDSRTEVELLYRLDVSPDGDKLGRDVFGEILDDLRGEDPTWLLGLEPAQAQMGALGTSREDVWLAYSRLRHFGPPFLDALERVLREPLLTLHHSRRPLPVTQVRRVDVQTATQIARTPALVRALADDGAMASSASPRTVRASVLRPHVDNAANRCLRAMVSALRRRTRACLRGMREQVRREAGSETRTGLAARWPTRQRYLETLAGRLTTLLQRPPLSQVRRVEPSAAGLNAISAHPLYAQAYKLGWKALRRGLEGDWREDRSWLAPTWELYERWCFVALRRMLQESLGVSGHMAHSPHPSCEHVWTALASDGTRYALMSQVEFKSWSVASEDQFRTLSRRRCPDLVLSVERGVVRAFLVLDAKYRQSRSNVLDAMASAHIYHDALRWGVSRPHQALLLIPAGGGAPWLESSTFHAQHGVGVIPMSPSTMEAASAAVMASVQTMMASW